MKHTITVFLIFISGILVKAQQYISLEDLQKNFKVNAFTLNPQNLYGVEGKIEIYNVYIGKNSILLLSVFPVYEEHRKTKGEPITPTEDLKSKLDKEFSTEALLNEKNKSDENIGANWKPVDYQQIKDDVLTKDRLLSICLDWAEQNLPEKKTMQYKLLRKYKGKYYVAQMMLTELFEIGEAEKPFISPYGTINIKETKVSIAESEKSFQRQFPELSFPLDFRNSYRTKSVPVPYLVKFYLSKEYEIHGEKAYQFWTLDDWWHIDGYNEYRGIDRFVYIPGKGIVGGSYDFYFEYELTKIGKISHEKLWNNVINEKVMIAEELK